MKKIFSAFFLFVATTAFAQLRESMLAHVSDLPALPGSSIDAAAHCKNPQTGACNTDEVMKIFVAKHTAVWNQLNSTIPVGNTSMPDTSFVHSVQNMTPDQQRAWAMQYAQQQVAAAAAQPMKIPSPAESNFVKAYADLNLTVSSFTDSITLGWQRLCNDYDAHLAELDKKRKTQIAGCPMIAGGEGDGGPTPACVKANEDQYQSWVRSYYEQWLSQVTTFLNNKKTEMQQRYGNGETLLAQADYMSNPSQPAFKTDAISFQQSILTYQNLLAAVIEDTWKKGCEAENIVKDSKARCGETN